MYKLNENVGVVNWFTKEQYYHKYPEQTEKELNLLIEGIIEKLDKSNQLYVASDDIYCKIKTTGFLKEISSDSRLPVCSLFHHLKTTSGIAVCLMLQKLDTDQNYISQCLAEYNVSATYSKHDFKALIRLGALLHDLGKLRSYTRNSSKQSYEHHHVQTQEILYYILSQSNSKLVLQYELEKILPHIASNHHDQEAETQLERLICIADMVASTSNKIYEVEANYQDGIVKVKSNDKIFPHELDFNGGDLKCLETLHREIMFKDHYIEKPAEIISDGGNIQLFHDSVINGGRIQNLAESEPLSEDIGILSLDIMGIQGFINEADKLPMLRGGSALVSEALKIAEKIISEKICEEAILFSGGGNLLSFIPNTDTQKEKIKTQIENEISENTKNGLNTAIITFNMSLNDVGSNFNSLLKSSQQLLTAKKNETRNRSPILMKNKICRSCFKRKLPDNSDKCPVCKAKEVKGNEEKYSQANQFIEDTYGLNRSVDLTQIGNSIAVLAIDGNMMGRMFQQTTTPSEYTYKSETFSHEFDLIIKKTINKFSSDDEKREDLIKHKIGNKEFLGIDVLYVGGDDALIIINAKGAVKFADLLIKYVSDKFTFKKEFQDGTSFENPIITISCGIAIADSKFPIYFLLDAARDMESKAKKAFREDADTDEFGFIKIPRGALAITAVSSAMPSDDSKSFVFPADERNIGNSNIAQLNKLLEMALDNENRSVIADIITCGSGVIDRLNMVKSLYSSFHRKKNFSLDKCEMVVGVLLNEEIMYTLKMLVPHIWHEEEIT